jgi:hypothetical protein
MTSMATPRKRHAAGRGKARAAGGTGTATARPAGLDRRSVDGAPLRVPDAGDTPSTGRGKYVYCIVRSVEPLRFGRIGLGSEPAEVTTVHYKDIAAVVSDTPIEVPDATRENVLAHERVNETVMRAQTVIPMSFGTVFKTPEDIVELLRGAYDAFNDVLLKMEDKLEFGLKLLWEREQVIPEIERDDEEVRRLKKELSSQKGSTYFARVQYGRLSTARSRPARSATSTRS